MSRRFSFGYPNDYEHKPIDQVGKGPLKITPKTIEKVHLIFLTSFLGVSLPYPRKRSSIVDRITKPLFYASYKEICLEAFSTDSQKIVTFACFRISHNFDVNSMAAFSPTRRPDATQGIIPPPKVPAPTKNNPSMPVEKELNRPGPV
jgi:hypothetical protein